MKMQTKVVDNVCMHTMHGRELLVGTELLEIMHTHVLLKLNVFAKTIA